MKKLYCIFKCHPDHVVYEMDEGGISIYKEHITPGPRWPYGEIRGGTVPVVCGNKWLRFFHSGLDNEWFGSQPRRYFVGAYLMEPEPPFRVVTVSKRPIIYGSELCDVPIAERQNIIQYKVNVVFPGGVLERDGHWLLAVGINDSACAMAKITPQMLNL